MGVNLVEIKRIFKEHINNSLIFLAKDGTKNILRGVMDPQRDDDAVPKSFLKAENITVEPTGNLTAEDVQQALEDHQDDLDQLNDTSVNLQGEYNAATNTPDLDVSPTDVEKGDTYEVTTAGDFFTEAVEVGDVLIAKQDDPAVISDWIRINKNVNLIDFEQILYVGKHGDDTNDGTRPEKAFLTFAAAINEAVTQLFPSDTNRIAIVCEDGGTYSEGIAIPSFVHVFAPNATLIGGQIVNDDSFLHIGRLSTILPTALSKVSGTGDATVICDEIVITGAQLPVLVTFGDLHFKCSRIDCNSIAAIASTSSGELTVDIDHITCNTSPAFGAIAQFGTGDIRGVIRRIEDAALTGGTAFNFGAAGNIDIISNNITCVQLYANALGTLNIISNEITATVNSTGAGATTVKINNPARAEIFEENNAAATVNPGIGTYALYNVTPTAGILNDFTHDGAGRLTFTRTWPGTFAIYAKADVSLAIAGLTQLISGIHINAVLSQGGQARGSKIANTANVSSMVPYKIVTLNPGDIVDLRGANQTNANSFTAEFYNIAIHEIF